MRSRHDRYLFGLWLARWGFALSVAAVFAAALLAAVTVSLPAPVPSIALRATAVYRFEVGAAVFFGLYIAAMALALALQNRGFTEIGSNGIRARDLSDVSDREDHVTTDLIAELFDELQDLRARWEEGQSGDQASPG